MKMQRIHRLKKKALPWAALAALALGTTAATAASPVTIKFSSWLPVNHWHTEELIIPYLKEIEEVTEGRVKIDILPKVVGKPQNQFDVVRNGLADMSWMIPGYTPDRFPLSEFGTLPFMGDDLAMAPSFHRLYMEELAEFNEFAGVELLAIYTIPPGHLATNGKAIESFEDIEGLKLRSISQVTNDALDQWGAVPINKASSELYELLATGQIDGSLMIPETVTSNNLLDLLDTYTKAPGGFYTAVHAMVLNPRKWAEISPKDQAAIREISGETIARKSAQLFHDHYLEAYKAMEKADYTINTLSPEVVGQMKRAIQPIEDSWVRKAKDEGVKDPQAILDTYRAAANGAKQ